MATVKTAMLGNLPYTALRDALFTHLTAAEGLTLLLANVTSNRLQTACREHRFSPNRRAGSPLSDPCTRHYVNTRIQLTD